MKIHVHIFVRTLGARNHRPRNTDAGNSEECEHVNLEGSKNMLNTKICCITERSVTSGCQSASLDQSVNSYVVNLYGRLFEA